MGQGCFFFAPSLRGHGEHETLQKHITVRNDLTAKAGSYSNYCAVGSLRNAEGVQPPLAEFSRVSGIGLN